MKHKTVSLSFPSNPLAALRELQELDAIPKNDALEPDATALPVTPTTSSVTSSAVASTESSEVVNATVRPGTKRARREPSPSSDPLAEAVKERLARPYPDSETKGAMTVSTVKMPSEVWERLGWAAKLTGLTKQEIIAEALKDYFPKMLAKL